MKTPPTSCRPAANAALTTLLALLAGCGGYGSGGGYASGMTNTSTNMISPVRFCQRSRQITTIGSTLDPPIEHGNCRPMDLTVATATAGLITKGDLIVCNFNDGAPLWRHVAHQPARCLIGLRSPTQL